MLRVHRTGYHPPGAVASELAWLQALRRDEGLLTPAVYASLHGRQVLAVHEQVRQPDVRMDQAEPVGVLAVPASRSPHQCGRRW